MLQCVTVCCSMLLCVIEIDADLQENALQSVAVCRYLLQSVTVCCGMLQCVLESDADLQEGVLQFVAGCCSVLQVRLRVMQIFTKVCCSLLQSVAVCCSSLWKVTRIYNKV